MTETIPVYIKGKDDIVLLEPAPANQRVGWVEAIAETHHN